VLFLRKIKNNVVRLFAGALIFFLQTMAATAQAPVTVTFDAGVIGTFGSNTGKANDVVNSANVGITSATFTQISNNGRFGGTQGNDFCGTLTLNGPNIQFAACVTWRITTGNYAEYIGFIPDTAANNGTIALPYTGAYGPFQPNYNLVISSSINNASPESNFAFRTRTAAPSYADGADISGNASASSALSSLNNFLDAAASTATSTITASPTSIAADGTTTSTITVQLKDANGNNLTTSGGTVALTKTLGTLGAVTDNNNGTYTATLTSSTTAGTATISGTLGGAAITDTATVTMVGSSSPVITGPSGGAGAATSAIRVNENQTAVTQFTANVTISSWTLSGADAAKSAIAADGTLTFVAAPDFDNPTDAGGTAGNNTYVVIISATDTSSNASSQMLTVTVANVEDTPAEAFAANAQTIRQVVADEANRTLRNTVSANRNMVQSARDRFADDVRQNAACGRDDQIDQEDRAYGDFQEVCTETVATRNYIPFDVDGAFSLSGVTLSTNGTFFGQSGSADGTWRRLFFGDFNVQRDGNTGSNTATLSARIAWEQMVSETTMLGYFIGAELGDSDIKGSFTGDQSRVALTLGGYAVHQLAEQVYLDGFLTLGAGRNDLSMANSVLSLDSDYSTRTATLGAAVSGIYDYEAYEFHPELSFSYGRTWIGNVGFTGRAYGLVDNTLSLDAGHVSVANLTFRPEVIWGLDGETVASSTSQLSFAPRMICEQTRALRSTNDCGGGAELGLSTQSDDGLTNAEFRVLKDRIGSSDRTSYAISLEHRF